MQHAEMQTAQLICQQPEAQARFRLSGAMLKQLRIFLHLVQEIFR